MNTFKERTIISFILLVVLTMLPMDGYAHKLELQDSSSIRIEKIGHQYKNDTIFKFDKQAPNSILIDEIVLSKNDGKTHPLFILCGNDTLLNKKAAKSLNQRELENGVNLLSTQNYVIKHGDNEWNLKFTEESLPPTEPVTQEISEPAPVEKSESSFPWWLTSLLSLLLGAIIGVGTMWLLAKNHKKKHKDKMNSVQPEDDSSQDHELGSGQVEMPRKDQNEKDLSDSVLDSEDPASRKKDQIPYNDEKYLQLQKSFDDIRTALGLAVGSDPKLCIQRINKLKQQQNSLQEQKPVATESQKSDCEEVLQRIKNKDSKELKELVAKAQDQLHTDSPVEILKKMMDLLPSRLRQSNVVQQKGQQTAITDEQLRLPENRGTLKLWLVEKLEDAGFKGLNKNNLVELESHLEELAKKLNAPEPKVVEEKPREADEKIVSRFIQEDKLSEEDKKILLTRLIEKMNGQIESEDAKLDTNLSLEDYLRRVIEKLQMPNTHEEAQAMEKKNNIAAVNQLLGSKLEDFDSNALKAALEQAILQQLKEEFKLSTAASLDDTISQLKQSESQANQLKALIQKYAVEKAKDVPKAVLDKELEDIKKPIAAKLQEILPDQPLDSLQKLVNQLLAKAESFKKDYEGVSDELEESLASRDNSEFTSNNQKASELLSLLLKSVKEKESTLTSTIKDRDNRIEDLNATIEGNKTQISNLKQEKQMLMSPSAQLVEALHEKATAVREAMKTILNPCSDADEAQCIDIEDRLFNSLKQFVDQVRSFNVNINTTPVETRKQAQRLLVNGITQDNSAINTICRYYAYSRLPFMTDTSREYGITFKRRNMVELFNSIANMYTMLSINFEIPSLFVMGLDDGDFENKTGQAYGDLDNLCQNSRNHFDNIDSKVKPANVIVDIVNVGYSIDGQSIRKPSVLTY